MNHTTKYMVLLALAILASQFAPPQRLQFSGYQRFCGDSRGADLRDASCIPAPDYIRGRCADTRFSPQTVAKTEKHDRPCLDCSPVTFVLVSVFCGLPKRFALLHPTPFSSPRNMPCRTDQISRYFHAVAKYAPRSTPLPFYCPRSKNVFARSSKRAATNLSP